MKKYFGVVRAYLLTSDHTDLTKCHPYHAPSVLLKLTAEFSHSPAFQLLVYTVTVFSEESTQENNQIWEMGRLGRPNQTVFCPPIY